MNSFFQKISTNTKAYILFFVALMFGVVLISSLIELLIIGETSNSARWLSYSLLEKILLVIIIPPIIETFINQWLVFKMVGSYTDNRIFIILVSAVIFGLLHGPDYIKMTVSFFLGIILMSAFIMWEGKSLSKYLVTVIIHMLYNAILVILSFFR